MFKHLLFYSGLASAALVGPTKAEPEFGTASDAKAMLDRAIVEIKTDKTGAINKFNFNYPSFRDRDLFVFCFNRRDGKFTAHEAMVGWDVRELHDIWGSPFGEEMFAVRDGQTIEVTYMSPVPGSISLAPKRAFVKAIDDQACGVSVYELNGQASRTQ